MSHIMSGRLPLIPVGAGSPIIFAKNGQSHKPAPAMYYGRSIAHDITGFIRFIRVVALIECQLRQSCLTFYLEKGLRLG
jgi:hypothetical protein